MSSNSIASGGGGDGDDDYDYVNDEDLQKIDEILQTPLSQKKLKTSSGGEKKVVSQSSKPKQSRQNKREEDKQAQKAQAEKEVAAVKSLLEKYHRRDVNAVTNKEPALTKVKHIDEVLEKLSKVTPDTALFV